MTLQLYWSSIGGVEDGEVRYGIIVNYFKI